MSWQIADISISATINPTNPITSETQVVLRFHAPILSFGDPWFPRKGNMMKYVGTWLIVPNKQNPQVYPGLFFHHPKYPAKKTLPSPFQSEKPTKQTLQQKWWSKGDTRQKTEPLTEVYVPHGQSTWHSP